MRTAQNSPVPEKATQSGGARDQLSSALAEQTELARRYEGALEGGRLALFDWRVGTNEVHTNHLWLDLLGYDEHDFGPGFDVWEKLIHPDDLDDGLHALNSHISGVTDHYEVVMRMQHKDGGWRYMRCAGEVTERDENGIAIRMIGTQQDVTSTIETQLAFEQAAKEAQSAVRAKSAFLSNMSHEIRTPLNGVVGMLELIAAYNTDPKIDRFIDSANECATTLDALIGRLLELGRLESEADNIAQDACDPDRFFANLARAMEALAHKAELDFKYELSACDNRMIVTDEARLAQIINNLLGNAIKFTNEGHVGLRVNIAEDTDNAHHGLCEIEVFDSGIGIASNKLTTIFGRFEQLNAGNHRQNQGVGLGLSIVKEIVDQLGGETRVYSELGRGTKFTVHIPIVFARDDTAAKPTDKLYWRAQPQQRVLIADDNHFNMQILSEYMAIFDLSYDSAVDGSEVLQKASVQKYDLILMDICMPILDGVEATKIIKSDAENKNFATPIMGLTANSFPKDIADFKAAGMDSVLVKPYHACDLQTRLQKYLG